MNKKIFDRNEQATSPQATLPKVAVTRDENDEVTVIALQNFEHYGIYVPVGSVVKMKKTHADFHITHGSAKLI